MYANDGELCSQKTLGHWNVDAWLAECFQIADWLVRGFMERTFMGSVASYVAEECDGSVPNLSNKTLRFAVAWKSNIDLTITSSSTIPTMSPLLYCAWGQDLQGVNRYSASCSRLLGVMCCLALCM
jgi:hypothetical protein